MVPRNFFSAILCTALLTWSGLAIADPYRPDEFLSLDLSRAVLSPKPLGPAGGFTPGPLDVKTDNGDRLPGQRRNANTENRRRTTGQHRAKSRAHHYGPQDPNCARGKTARFDQNQTRKTPRQPA